jgi:hypothetical protein
LRPAERGEGALGVVPVPDLNRGVLTYPMPDWAERLASSGKPSALFIDEVSSAPPALQPSIMGLALDGIIAGQRLPESVKRIAAANPVDQAAGGWDLAPALANRFIHIEWKSPKADEWTSWLAGQSESAGIVKIDEVEWERQWGQARSLGTAFIRSHPTALHEDVAKVVGTRTPPAYATPRTWECALRLLASCRACNAMDLYPELAQGTLGPAVALQGGKGSGAWLTWLADNDLPDPEEILKDPDKFKHEAKRPDRSYATLLAVAEAGLAKVNGKPLTEKERGERWECAWAVLYRAFEIGLGKDIILLPGKVLTDKNRWPKTKFGPYAKKVSSVLFDFLKLVEQ